MRKTCIRKLTIAVLLIAAAALAAPSVLPAQGTGVTLIVTRTDSANAPDYTALASVVSPEGLAVDGLAADAFSLVDSIDAAPIPVSAAQPVNAGIAAVIVVDAGGLSSRSPRGVPYQEEVERLARQFVDALTQTSPEQQNYGGLVIVVGTGADKMAPGVALTSDLGALSNQLESIKTVKAEPTTALYDGLNAALQMLNSTPGIEHKRKAVLLFSDGADQKFSGEAILGNIASMARERSVAVYTLQVRKRGSVEAHNMSVLAEQSGGRYELVDGAPAEISPKVSSMYDAVTSRRNQYQIAFHSVRPAGDHAARLSVTTPHGDATARVDYQSNLKPPVVRVIAPPAGTVYVQGGADAIAPITLTAEVEFPDGKARPVAVTFRAGDMVVDKREAPPYEVVWAPAAIAQASVAQPAGIAIRAEAADSWLTDSKAQSDPVNVTIQVAALPTPTPKLPVDTLRENLPVLVALCGLGIVVLALFVVLIFVNRSLSAQVQQLRGRIQTGVVNPIRSMTRKLIGQGQQPIAEFDVIQGPMGGQTLRMYNADASIGRDDNNDIRIYDDTVSSQHCRISYDAAAKQFFILDEHSSNGTLVNRVQLAQKMRTPLAPDSTIQIGSTVMVFKVGRKTQQLAQLTQQAP